MIRYYKLFDLLNRRNMKLSDLRSIISSATVAKLRKGEYISGEVIEKICLYLKCDVGDIMEVVEVTETIDESATIITKYKTDDNDYDRESIDEQLLELHPSTLDINISDEEGLTQRTKM